MGRKLVGIVRNGKYIDLEEGAESFLTPVENVGPFIHDDTMPPLRHPVTGHYYESKSAYMACNKRNGLEVVGNDLLSNRPRKVQDKLTDAVIMDRIERAEAILSDDAKYRARQNENYARLEKAQRMLEGKH